MNNNDKYKNTIHNVRYFAEFFRVNQKLSYNRTHGYTSVLDQYDYINNQDFEYGCIIKGGRIWNYLFSDFLITRNYLKELINFLDNYQLEKENQINYISVISLGYKRNNSFQKVNKLLLPIKKNNLLILKTKLDTVYYGRQPSVVAQII